MDVRPTWDFQLPENTFRALIKRPITRVDHAWRFLTADTAENWINLKLADNGNDKGDTIQIAEHKLSAFFTLFKFAPDHCRLFGLTYEGERAQKKLAEIDKFERTYGCDRREYERLKKKFEDAP